MKFRMNRAQARRRQSGVYMLDMLIALSVAAVLLSTAIPTYSAVVHKNRISAVTTELYVSLNLARSEALKRRSAVRVCPSEDSASCRNDGDWSDGWLIFEDVNSNNTAEAAEIIRVVDGFDGQIEMQVAATLSSYVQFQPTGVAIGNGGNTGEFRLCHSESASYSTAVSVSATGRINSVTRTQSDCDAI